MTRVLLFATMLLVAANACSAAGDRAALVVGIGDYASLPHLPNAVADARAIGDALGRAGFRVSLLVDPDTAALRAAVAGIQTSASGASAALFYYAGHAVQFQNRNYLLAADAAPHSADELEDQGLDVTRVIMRMAEAAAAVRLIFVDACRDSPLAFIKDAEGGRGLAPIVAGPGTTIVFSAAPEHAASDGAGDHSPFATALLRHILSPGLELSPMLRQVANDLRDETQHQQELQPLDNRLAAFFFLPPGGLPAASASPSAVAPETSNGIARLISDLQPFSATKRLYKLEDALKAAPLPHGLDAGQALAIMGDIPAPALRRHALAMLLPSLHTPIAEPEATQLLESFDGDARGVTLEMLLPCLARPTNDGEAARILGDIRPPARSPLEQMLRRPGRETACPATRT
jgi:uncharacterized caspase-like protein